MNNISVLCYTLNLSNPSLTTKFNTCEKLIDFGEVLIILACMFRSFSTFAESNTTVILSPNKEIT